MLAGPWILSGVESGLLYTALTAYGGATVVGLRVVGGRRRGRALRPMLSVGTVALALLLLAVALREGYVPVMRRYEMVLVSALVLAGAGWVLDRRLGLPMLAAVAAPTLALLTFFALLLVPDAGVTDPDRRLGTTTHIVLALLGFAALTFAAGVGTLYLWQIRIMKRRPTAAVARRMPPLELLDRLNFLAVAFGFPLLALSALGAALFLERTSESSSSSWLDPTILATLGGLLVYGVLFATRALLGWYGRRIAWLTVLGFLFIVAAFVVAAYCTSASVLHNA